MNTDRARTAAKAVDQAVISVHRRVGPTHGERIRSELRELGLASPGLLLDVAEFLLGDALTTDVMRLRYRYLTRPISPMSGAPGSRPDWSVPT